MPETQPAADTPSENSLAAKSRDQIPAPLRWDSEAEKSAEIPANLRRQFYAEPSARAKTRSGKPSWNQRGITFHP